MAYPLRPLGECLRYRKEFVTIDDVTEYTRCRVQLRGQGVVLRDRVLGAEIKTRTQQVCRTGELLVAEIDAKLGAFAVVPEALDGAIVSSHYFLFEIDETQLDREFLAYYVQTPMFLGQVKAQGSTNYAAIRPDDVLAYVVPLPGLEQQKATVRRIDYQSARLAEVRRVGTANATALRLASGNLVLSVFARHQDRGTWAKHTLGEYVAEASYGTSEKASEDPSGIPVLRMGNIRDGLLVVQGLKYLPRDSSFPALGRGDILVNRTNSAALVGKCAVFDAPGEFTYASYLIRLRVHPDRALPTLLAAYLNSAVGRSYFLATRKQMTGQANINLRSLLALPVALPDLALQRVMDKQVENLNEPLREARRLQDSAARQMENLSGALLKSAFRS